MTSRAVLCNRRTKFPNHLVTMKGVFLSGFGKAAAVERQVKEIKMTHFSFFPFVNSLV